MPVTTVPGEPRRLDTENCAHASGAYFGNQLCKARPLNLARSGAPKVFVDNLDLVESKLPRSVRQSILASLALQIVGHLHWRGLPNIHDRPSPQMIRGHFAACGHASSPFGTAGSSASIAAFH